MALDVEASFGLLLGQVGDIHTQVMRAKSPQPLVRDFSAAITIPAGTPLPYCLIVNNMWPAQGRMWEITQCGVFGPDGHTSVAGGIADMYAGPTAGTDAPGDLAAFIASGSIPVNQLIGDHKVYAYANDRIYAWIYGVTLPVNITIAGTVRDWRMEDRSEMTI